MPTLTAEHDDDYPPELVITFHNLLTPETLDALQNRVKGHVTKPGTLESNNVVVFDLVSMEDGYVLCSALESDPVFGPLVKDTAVFDL